MKKNLKELKKYLAAIPAGKVSSANKSELRRLLVECWGAFSGSHLFNMTAEKAGRAEHLEWESPCLYYTIERRGRAVRGWQLNVETGNCVSAMCG
jgi:hypothetical protein